ncbi:hypothetical protein [Nocardia sp. alder85J]|uniref:hypothetical protein n=1 Tax=Nocardia sp. alder85J TaxID=2862949 RepID=UPI001CD332A7|nr:hypothetical protein [Nocardia sp. alder85J]MCX4093587.1 hypothetical protein [Nocardia sp. alder85J]
MSRNTDRLLFRTVKDVVSAMWEIPAGGAARIMHLNDPQSRFPARRWPNEPMEALPDGHIAFGPEPHQRPTLAQVREMLPQYAGLWDEIREESLINHTVLVVNNRPSGCNIGRMFTSADGLTDWTERVRR